MISADPKHSAIRGTNVGLWSLATLVSFVLPAVIGAWFLQSTVSDKPLYEKTRAVPKYRNGFVKDGELWYPEIRLADVRPRGMPRELVPEKIIIRRLNLTDLIDRETELEVPEVAAKVAWLNGELYVFSDTKVFKQEGTKLVELARLPAGTGTLIVTPFLYHGKLTTVAEFMDSKPRFPSDFPGELVYRLVQLVDGAWVDVGAILLPEPGRFMCDYPNPYTPKLVRHENRHSRKHPSSREDLQYLTVIEEHGTCHVLLVSGFQYALYRPGLQFLDDHLDTASAIAPENSQPEIFGWEVVPLRTVMLNWHTMHAVTTGALLVSASPNMNRTILCIQRRLDGRFQDLSHVDKRLEEPSIVEEFVIDEGLVLLLPSDERNEGYILREEKWHSASLTRISPDGTVLAQQTIVGKQKPYIERWERVALAIVAMWATHIGLISALAALCERTSFETNDAGPDPLVLLASPARRGAAMCIDFVLLGVILSVTVQVVFFTMGVDWASITEFRLADSLQRGATHGYYSGWRSLLNLPQTVHWIVTSMLYDRQEQENARRLQIWNTLKFALMSVTAFAFAVRVYFEGRFGITPGKWLLGLRTVRTTMRPCGIPRALLRDAIIGLIFPC